jgi:hypothetical protein
MKIKVSTDFTTAPGPRYAKEGQYSGEQFRTELLLPKLREAISAKCSLEIDLDGTAGYGTSFLEESFGGLIREDKIDVETIRGTIKLVSKEQPDLIDEIEEYLDDADKETIQ